MGVEGGGVPSGCMYAQFGSLHALVGGMGTLRVVGASLAAPAGCWC
jgi:hypothetical protein